MSEKYCCPKCKGTKFSVLVEATQEWDSELDEWDNIEVLGIIEKEDTYVCVNCNAIFKDINELKEIK
jgi:DNA-directed RNA polymerase subunit RPC12/RpoP